MATPRQVPRYYLFLLSDASVCSTALWASLHGHIVTNKPTGGDSTNTNSSRSCDSRFAIVGGGVTKTPLSSWRSHCSLAQWTHESVSLEHSTSEPFMESIRSMEVLAKDLPTGLLPLLDIAVLHTKADASDLPAPKSSSGRRLFRILHALKHSRRAKLHFVCCDPSAGKDTAPLWCRLLGGGHLTWAPATAPAKATNSTAHHVCRALTQERAMWRGTLCVPGKNSDTVLSGVQFEHFSKPPSVQESWLCALHKCRQISLVRLVRLLHVPPIVFAGPTLRVRLDMAPPRTQRFFASCSQPDPAQHAQLGSFAVVGIIRTAHEHSGKDRPPVTRTTFQLMPPPPSRRGLASNTQELDVSTPRAVSYIIMFPSRHADATAGDTADDASVPSWFATPVVSPSLLARSVLGVPSTYATHQEKLTNPSASPAEVDWLKQLPVCTEAKQLLEDQGKLCAALQQNAKPAPTKPSGRGRRRRSARSDVDSASSGGPRVQERLAGGWVSLGGKDDVYAAWGDATPSADVQALACAHSGLRQDKKLLLDSQISSTELALQSSQDLLVAFESAVRAATGQMMKQTELHLAKCDELRSHSTAMASQPQKGTKDGNRQQVAESHTKHRSALVSRLLAPRKRRRSKKDRQSGSKRHKGKARGVSQLHRPLPTTASVQYSPFSSRQLTAHRQRIPSYVRPPPASGVQLASLFDSESGLPHPHVEQRLNVPAKVHAYTRTGSQSFLFKKYPPNSLAAPQLAGPSAVGTPHARADTMALRTDPNDDANVLDDPAVVVSPPTGSPASASSGPPKGGWREVRDQVLELYEAIEANDRSEDDDGAKKQVRDDVIRKLRDFPGVEYCTASHQVVEQEMQRVCANVREYGTNLRSPTVLAGAGAAAVGRRRRGAEVAGAIHEETNAVPSPRSVTPSLPTASSLAAPTASPLQRYMTPSPRPMVARQMVAVMSPYSLGRGTGASSVQSSPFELHRKAGSRALPLFSAATALGADLPSPAAAGLNSSPAVRSFQPLASPPVLHSAITGRARNAAALHRSSSATSSNAHQSPLRRLDAAHASRSRDAVIRRNKDTVRRVVKAELRRLLPRNHAKFYAIYSSLYKMLMQILPHRGFPLNQPISRERLTVLVHQEAPDLLGKVLPSNTSAKQ